MAVNHHLRLALDQVSDAVAVIDSVPLTGSGPLLAYANQAMAEGTGLPVSTLCGAPLSLLLGPADLASMLAHLAAGREASGIAGRLLLQGGEATPCLWTCAPVPDHTGATVNFILTAQPIPVTAAASGPPSPLEYHADVVETVRETARYVAHEFRNALSGILAPVQMAFRDQAAQGPLRDQLEVAYASAQQAAGLARDFLDCFKPKQKSRQQCALAPLLGRAMRLATCGQRLDWSMELAGDLHDAILDQGDIERVIFNLVRNACQAMPGGGKLRVRGENVEVPPGHGETLQPGPYVQISVRDFGPGIPEEHLPHLFHSCFTTKDDGNGCGLPICYKISREHGGTMFVKSRVNVGTEFILYLPAVPAAVGHAPAAAPVEMPAATGGQWPAQGQVPRVLTSEVVLPPLPSAPGPSTAPVAPVAPVVAVEDNVQPAQSPAAAGPGEMEPSATMLVIDDEDSVCRALTQLGRRYGMEVIAMQTGESGLQAYRDRLSLGRPFNMVVLDMNLRGIMMGNDVFSAITRIDHEARIVATSGEYTEEDLVRLEQTGYCGFLPKPFTLDEFEQVINDVLAEPATA